MRISNITITNFRSLEEVSIDFSDVTSFIGPNGAGKSTVFKALDWFFNGRNQPLGPHDFTHGCSNKDIEVQVSFSSLTDDDRRALGRYAPDGIDTFSAWKKRTAEGVEYLSANAKGFPAFNDIKAAIAANPKKALYNELRRESPELGLPDAKTSQAVDEAILQWEASNVSLLEDVPEELHTNFFGFNGGGKMSGLFDFVLVSADLRASEEAEDSKSSIIGRLLERSIDRTAADEAIGNLIEEVQGGQQEVYRNLYSEQLVAIDEMLNEVATGYSPGRKVEVVPSKVELRVPKTVFDVEIVDGPLRTSVDRQGHGFQRAILLSALQVLAQSNADSTNGVICLAIEEPELFQHPTQAQAFSKVLRSLASDPSKRMQVAYATHSPFFVDAKNFSQVRRHSRPNHLKPSVVVRSSCLSDVKSRLNGYLEADKVESQLGGTLENRLSSALFAERVLLVEGPNDAALIEGVADRASYGLLESEGVAVVAVGGKSGIPLAHAILASLGIPVYALFDCDSGFATRARASGKSDSAITKERENHVAANHSLLRYFKLPVVDFPDQYIGDQVAILEDRIEEHLEKNWQEWTRAFGDLERRAGVSLKKNSAAFRSASLTAQGEPSIFLGSLVAQARGLGSLREPISYHLSSDRVQDTIARLSGKFEHDALNFGKGQSA